MKRKSVIFAGPQRCGKSTAARALAKEVAADPEKVFVITEFSWRIPPFGLSMFLRAGTEVVIVEEADFGRLQQRDLFELRNLVAAKTLTMELRGQDPVQVPAPYFIFTTNSDVPDFFINDRRFEVRFL
jgi:hypothetical protein